MSISYDLKRMLTMSFNISKSQLKYIIDNMHTIYSKYNIYDLMVYIDIQNTTYINKLKKGYKNNNRLDPYKAVNIF